MPLNSLAGEEVRNAATVVPRSMIVGLFISGAFCIAFSIALLYCVGDLVTALSSPTRFPIIQIFYAATGSKVATTFITCGLVCTFIFSTFGTMASASRLTWAFARDKGFPFPAFFSHVRCIHVFFNKRVVETKHLDNRSTNTI